ncbi:MAG: D-Ala-D-Ala carboxypeptidase family metallohydrolase [Dehalococcoidales bacterium]|nr:D-Ala-D-Ala carboxypeptidase family metallohydrolase [Dehalococcoidales bacterium]
MRTKLLYLRHSLLNGTASIAGCLRELEARVAEMRTASEAYEAEITHMGDLSENFSRSEFCCKCGCGFCDPNLGLIEALQKLRDLAGKPISIVSGCRCERHNSNVGGAPNSYHLYGMAADIRIEGMSVGQIFKLAEEIPRFRDGGIGTYPSWVHVDVRPYKARWEA